MKNSTFAIDAALAAIPPKPKTAAMTAMIKNPADQRNIKYDLRFLNIVSTAINKILCHAAKHPSIEGNILKSGEFCSQYGK